MNIIFQKSCISKILTILINMEKGNNEQLFCFNYYLVLYCQLSAYFFLITKIVFCKRTEKVNINTESRKFYSHTKLKIGNVQQVLLHLMGNHFTSVGCILYRRVHIYIHLYTWTQALIWFSGCLKESLICTQIRIWLLSQTNKIGKLL